MTLERVIRTRPRTGLAIGEVLTQALASELLSPSPELWLVSGWVSDIVVIDNTSGLYDGLFRDEAPGTLTLTNVLSRLVADGTKLHVALRTDKHNETFIGRLRGACGDNQIHIYSSPDLHEKTLCAWSWVMSGSMNFTWNGTERNEENITYRHDPAWAARQRLELQQRWIGHDV